MCILVVGTSVWSTANPPIERFLGIKDAAGINVLFQCREILVVGKLPEVGLNRWLLAVISDPLRIELFAGLVSIAGSK